MKKATAMKGNLAAEKSLEPEEEESQPSIIDWKILWKSMSLIVALFIVLFYLPIENRRFAGAVIESLALAKWDRVLRSVLWAR